MAAAVVILVLVFGAMLSSTKPSPLASDVSASAFTSVEDDGKAADSSTVIKLAARVQTLSSVERLRMDELIHTRGFTFAHDSVSHRIAVDARLDSAEALLKPQHLLPQGFPALAQSMLILPDPLTGRQTRRAESLRQRASRQQSAADREQQVQSRRSQEDAVISQANCSPSRAKVRRLLERHADWGTDVIGIVACRRIRLGFTHDQVIASWGRPNDINRTTYSFGVHEQWVYGEYGGSYVYFEDGVVTTIQN